MTTRIDKNLRIEDALSPLIGKTISSIIVGHHENGNPRSRVFLMFSDGMAFELWTDDEDLSIASCLDESNVEQLTGMLRRRDQMRVCVIRAGHQDTNTPQKDLLSDY